MQGNSFSDDFFLMIRVFIDISSEHNILGIILTLFYMGFGGGSGTHGGTESAHPHQIVSKPYLCYEIDVEQLESV